jgi:tetratricopeptide (TPR) repeat protein
MSPTEVVIEVSGLDKKVPVNEIVAVYYDGEPSALKSARANVQNRAWENALEAVGRIDTSKISRQETLQEVAFLDAFSRAKLALQGSGEVKAAGSKLIGFTRQYPNSYHFFEASEVIGDLLVALGAHGQAETYYQRLAKAPWPDYKMRAGVAIGKARLAQGKYQEAAKAFEAVLSMSAGTPAAKQQHLAAKLGKAEVLVQTDQSEQAATILQDIIKNAAPENIDLHAGAYNTLGTAHRKAGRTKDALLAFLHVDTLFFQNGDAHARALANLAELWNAEGIHQPEKAEQAKQLLLSRYSGSPWAKKLSN